jgi:sigma-B regulation protein RsbU (phosphoserine phosphatase)
LCRYSNAQLFGELRALDMRLLLAEDNTATRVVLESTLRDWGYDVVATADGAQAWQELQSERAPELVLLDWTMPDLTGPDVCRRVRSGPRAQSTFIILLTARANREDLLAGFQAGADEYIVKPFDLEELRARLQAGARIVELQAKLAERVRDLEAALTRVKQLHGLLPICAYCKRIRDDHNYWRQVEAYVSEHSEAEFSHSICPDCYETVVKPELNALDASLPEGI